MAEGEVGTAVRLRELGAEANGKKPRGRRGRGGPPELPRPRGRQLGDGVWLHLEKKAYVHGFMRRSLMHVGRELAGDRSLARPWAWNRERGGVGQELETRRGRDKALAGTPEAELGEDVASRDGREPSPGPCLGAEPVAVEALHGVGWDHRERPEARSREQPARRQVHGPSKAEQLGWGRGIQRNGTGSPCSSRADSLSLAFF